MTDPDSGLGGLRNQAGDRSPFEVLPGRYRLPPWPFVLLSACGFVLWLAMLVRLS